jgi:hypothetical protein
LTRRNIDQGNFVTLGYGIQQYQRIGTQALLNLIARLQTTRCDNNGNVVGGVHGNGGMQRGGHRVNINLSYK